MMYISINLERQESTSFFVFSTKNVYLCSDMIKKILPSFFLLFLFFACNGIQVSEKLDQVDSLIVKEQYDSACALMKDIAKAPKTDDEQAHYYLLETQLSYLTNQPLESDSLLDLAVIYYNKVGNQEKLADAYYYKAYRSERNNDYPQAIKFCKEAERLAMNTNNYRIQYKIVESLAYLNGLCENDLLQLQYAKKALILAQMVKKGNWIAHSYNKISFAFYNLDQQDSAYYYIEKSIPYVKYVSDTDKAIYLMNIGVLYKEGNKEKAKEYFKKALSYGEQPEILEHIADVYYAEGNKEEAYRLWKKALTLDSRYEKDNLIYSILSYDLEHGNIEDASKNLDEVIAIKDSMIYVLRNDTIKDLQLRFDHEVAMHEADKKLISTQRLVLGLIILLGVMVIYIIIRKKKQEALEKEYQMQLYAYTTEINKLEIVRDNAQAQIKDLEGCKETDRQKICKLEEDVRNAEDAIEKYNKDIKKLLDDKAPRLNHGRLLYDQIMNGGTTSGWNTKDDSNFVYYFSSINYEAYRNIIKVKRASDLTNHNKVYLILKEALQKEDNEVRKIMGISPEGLRSIRMRTKPI